MNNPIAAQLIADCSEELKDIQKIVVELSTFDPTVRFLTNYSIVKSCGTIEQSFKTIVADYCENGQKPQVKQYIQSTFRESSRNPSYDNICRSLAAFDNSWNITFKQIIKNKRNATRLTDSLKSLNAARNDFAHGGNPSIAFASVINYFKDSITIIKVLDNIVV